MFNHLPIKLMDKKKKGMYSAPKTKVRRIDVEQCLLAASMGAKLNGAGIDESSADSNGSEIW